MDARRILDLLYAGMTSFLFAPTERAYENTIPIITPRYTPPDELLSAEITNLLSERTQIPWPPSSNKGRMKPMAFLTTQHIVQVDIPVALSARKTEIEHWMRHNGWGFVLRNVKCNESKDVSIRSDNIESQIEEKVGEKWWYLPK